MASKRHNDTPPAEVPEVATYQDAWSRYQQFRDSNPELFKHLDALQEELNTKCQAAEEAVSGRGISCGDFALYQYATKYSAEELLQAVGPDKFMQVGGSMTTQTVYNLDKKRVDAAIASGAIPAEAVGRVKVRSARYKKPSKVNIP